MALDLDQWSVIRPEPGGKDRDKLWLAETSGSPRTDHWLWKPRALTGAGESSISDSAEVISSRIAAALGLPAATCEFASRDGVMGVVSKNVTPSGHDLHSASSYLEEVDGYRRRALEHDDEGRPIGRMRRDEGYTLDAVGSVLRDVGPPPAVEQLTARAVFSGYLVLDALIANTDRHPGNWALLEARSSGQRTLAPSFDHGSALGSGLTDSNRRRSEPATFCARGIAKPFAGPRTSLVDLATRAARSWDGEVWLERLQDLSDDELSNLVDESAEHLSEVAVTFVKQVLVINKRRLGDADHRQD